MGSRAPRGERGLSRPGLASRAPPGRQDAARGEVKITHGLFILIVSRRVRVGRGVVQRPGAARGVVFPTATRGELASLSRSVDASIPRHGGGAPGLGVCSEVVALLVPTSRLPTSRSFSPFVEKVRFFGFWRLLCRDQVVPRPVRARRQRAPLTAASSGPQLARRRSPSAAGEPRLRRAPRIRARSGAAPRRRRGTRDAPRARAVPRRSVPRDEEVRREEVPLCRETHTRDGPGGARAILRRGRRRLAGSTALPVVPPAAWVLPGRARALPAPSEHTPQSQNDWGPSREGRDEQGSAGARQRQAEYNEQKARQERNPEAALEQKRRGGAMSHDHGDPRFAHGGGETRDRARHDVRREQRTEAEAECSTRRDAILSNIGRQAAAPRMRETRVRGGSAEADRRGQDVANSSRSSGRSTSTGTTWACTTSTSTSQLADGSFDGFDERGSMGVPVRGRTPPRRAEAVGNFELERRKREDVRRRRRSTPTTFTPIITRHRNTTAFRRASAPSGMVVAARKPGAVAPERAARASSPPGSTSRTASPPLRARREDAQEAGGTKRDLELQIAEKARRKAAEKLGAAGGWTPGTPRGDASRPLGARRRGRGRGAPMAYSSAPPDASGARPGYDDDRQSGRASLRTANRQSRTTARWYPRVETRTRRKIVEAAARGRAPATAAARRASNANPSPGGPASAAPSLARRARSRAGTRWRPRGA